jgi:glutathione peroxidase
MQSIYDIPIQDLEGNTTNLNAYRGQVMMIVNVASRCGFTPQYKQLELWYRQYQSQGFVVLGFPCNQFAGQEPENNQKIKAFAQSCFAVTFPLFAKIDVNGEHKAPIYVFLQAHLKNCFFKRIPWNFTKYLVNRKGEVCARFWPIAPRWWVEKRIQDVLKKEQ